MKTVSIIVPIYNTEKYLSRCLDSILSQTYKDYELILVNDGSTDTSLDICNKYSNEYDNIIIVNKQNGGLGSARNAGLDRANGKYIYFVDSDDYIDRDCLEKLVYTMEAEKADICACGMIKEYEDSSLNQDIHFFAYNISINSNSECLDFIIHYLLNYRIGWESWNRIFKTSIIKENNIRYSNERKVFAEDLLFALKYYLYVKKHVTINECMYHYTQRDGSLMKKVKAENLYNQINNFVCDIYEFLKQKNNTLFINNFNVIKYHLYEWHVRSYIEDNNLPINVKSILFPESFIDRFKYSRMIKKFGSIDGFISVGIFVEDEINYKKYEDTINSILNQRIKKIELLVFSKSKIVNKINDCRIKYLRCNNSNIYNLVNKKANGEFIYILDNNSILSDNYLSNMSDIIKYNNCGCCILGEYNKFIDINTNSFNDDIKKAISNIHVSDIMFNTLLTSKVNNIKNDTDYINMAKLGNAVVSKR